MVVLLKKQASDGKWLRSESIFDTVRVYIYLFSDDVCDFLNLELYQMVEKQDDLAEARQLRSNLE